MMGFVLKQEKLNFGTKKLCKFDNKIRVIIDTKDDDFIQCLETDQENYNNAVELYNSINNNTKIEFEYNILVEDSNNNGEELSSCDNLDDAEEDLNDLYNTYKDDPQWDRIILTKTPYVNEEIQDFMQILYNWDLHNESKEG